jgi:hypothetical protein
MDLPAPARLMIEIKSVNAGVERFLIAALRCLGSTSTVADKRIHPEAGPAEC